MKTIISLVFLSLASCHGQKTKSSVFDMKITVVENKKQIISKLEPELIIYKNKNIINFLKKDYNLYRGDIPPFIGF